MGFNLAFKGLMPSNRKITIDIPLFRCHVLLHSTDKFTKQRYLFFLSSIKTHQISETYFQLQYCHSHLSRLKMCHVTTVVDGKKLRNMQRRLCVVVLMFELSVMNIIYWLRR